LDVAGVKNADNLTALVVRSYGLDPVAAAAR
jgi:hypothetical protein